MLRIGDAVTEPDRRNDRNGRATMSDEISTYEAPAMIELGEFTEATLGIFFGPNDFLYGIVS